MPIIDTRTLPTGERLPGWKHRLFDTASMTFAHFTFEAGSRIHEHCHSNEEVWTVTEGELELTVGAETVIAKPGIVAVVPPFCPHSVRAVTDGKAIVTDCPVRVDPSGGRRAVLQVEFDTAVRLPENDAGPISIPFTIANTGQTRATVRAVDIETRAAVDIPDPTTTSIPSGDLPQLFIVDAGERHAATTTYSPEGQPSLNPSRVYVKGVLIYDDEFGGRQHSTFCRIYDPAVLDGQGGFVRPARPGYNYGT